VLLEAEPAPVGTAAHQRVVGDHDDLAPAGAREGGAESVHHLLLRVGGAGGRRVLRPRVGVEPPLRVEGDEPQPFPGVQGLRAGAAVVREVSDTRASPRFDPPLLPPHGLPAVASALRPVVVPGDEEDPRPGAADRVHLVVEPALHLRELGVAGRRQAGRVEVVAEEDHGRAAVLALELPAKGDQHRLAPLRRAPGVPDQEERLEDRAGLGVRGGRLAGRRGWPAGEQQREGGAARHPAEASTTGAPAASIRARTSARLGRRKALPVDRP
jgi:hypothetical protein